MTAALLNGVPATANVWGNIVGTNGGDKIAGSSGNDRLSGGKGVDYLYGGAGSDTFMFRASDFDATLGRLPQDYIHDFSGAGVFIQGDNDFIHFSGFGAGSTLTFDAARTALHVSYGYDPLLQYYNLFDAATGNNYVLSIKSLNGNVLGNSDYNFY